jgi:hypothetical protein
MALKRARAVKMNLPTLAKVMRDRDALRSLPDFNARKRAQFLNAWTKVAAWEGIRAEINDDDLWFGALRKLLPAYVGDGAELCRGQQADKPVGMSWSRGWHIAEGFALYGSAVPREQRIAKRRPNPVVLMATVPASEILCAPCLLGHKEGEYIIDPRRVVIDRRVALTTTVDA